MLGFAALSPTYGVIQPETSPQAPGAAENRRSGYNPGEYFGPGTVIIKRAAKA
jgi:hypothetical protein